MASGAIEEEDVNASSGDNQSGRGSHDSEDEGRSGFRFNFNFRLSKFEHRREGEERGRKSVSSSARPAAREVLTSEGIDSKKFASEPVSLQRGLVLYKGRVSSSELLGIAQSDLVPGKYEGGFKLWECTIDLIEALRREIQDARLTFRGKNVLELGCGHGLPGILACLKGAACVHFQDYNVEVLTHLTIPNVTKNLSHASARPRRNSEGVVNGVRSSLTQCDIRYFAGDWADMDGVLSSTDPVFLKEGHVQSGTEDSSVPSSSDLKSWEGSESDSQRRESAVSPEGEGSVEGVGSPTRNRHGRSFSRANEIAVPFTSGGYDVILMSETVYSTASMPKLLNIIKNCLRPPYGVVYVAGKKHYFGVGGGTRQFKSLVVEDGALSGHLVAEFVDGSSNMREIWKFFFPLQRQRA